MSKSLCIWDEEKGTVPVLTVKIKIVEFSIQCHQILWIHSHWILFNSSVCVPYTLVSSLNTQLFFTLTHGLAAGSFYYFFPSWVKVFGSLPSEECEFGDGFFVYLILITMMSIQKISCLNIPDSNDYYLKPRLVKRFSQVLFLKWYTHITFEREELSCGNLNHVLHLKSIQWEKNYKIFFTVTLYVYLHF